MYQYIFFEVLVEFRTGLDKFPYSQFVIAMRVKVLQCFRELLPFEAPAKFFESVLKSFDDLCGRFEEAHIERLNKSGLIHDDENKFRELLKKCALPTEQLELHYFLNITEMSFTVNIVLYQKNLFRL